MVSSIYLDAEIAHSALDLRMAEQQLDGTQVAVRRLDNIIGTSRTPYQQSVSRRPHGRGPAPSEVWLKH